MFDFIYLIVLLLLAPVLLFKAIFDSRFRAILARRFFPNPKIPPGIPTIWVHAASAGEALLAVKLIKKWRPFGPRFILTTNTFTGLEIARKEKDWLPSCLSPFDLSSVVRRFIRKCEIKALILIEAEIWPNTIRICGNIGKTAVVNGRLSDRHIDSYRRFKPLLKKTFGSLDLVIAGDEVSRERFSELGAPNVCFEGNFKFELAERPSREVVAAMGKKHFLGKNGFLFVAGSVQPEEIEPIMEAFGRLKDNIPGFRLAVVPRHPEKKDIFIRELKKSDLPIYVASEASSSSDASAPVLFIDLMGVLRSWYFSADAVFVGGSLSQRGGQNMLEAISYRKPVAIGPFTTNFQQETNLLANGGGLIVVQNGERLASFVERVYREPDWAESVGRKGRDIIFENSGGLEKGVERLRILFSALAENEVLTNSEI